MLTDKKMSILLFITQQDFPQKIQVELIDSNLSTNLLIILNIVVSIIVAWFIRDRIEKKAKEYEVAAHIKKLKAEKTIDFCINLNHVFTKLCLKNPRIHQITNSDIEELNSKIHCEELLFIDNRDIENIKKFRDYIIQIRANPANKNLAEEKSFFFLIKNIVNK